MCVSAFFVSDLDTVPATFLAGIDSFLRKNYRAAKMPPPRFPRVRPVDLFPRDPPAPETRRGWKESPRRSPDGRRWKSREGGLAPFGALSPLLAQRRELLAVAIVHRVVAA